MMQAEALREMTEEVQQLVQQERLFAIQNVSSTTRVAKISFSGDQLRLHHLMEGHPPPNVHLLDFHDVLSLVDPSSRLTFLELGTTGSSLGDMIISLSPDTKGAQQFALLCSGEMGVSYANTKLFQVHHRGKKWEYVGGGDYEYNNGEGGRALLSGLELGPEYERRCVAGIVRGFWGLGSTVSTQFFINTRDNSSGTSSPAFGKVIKGLEVLREAVRLYPDITEVSVLDCGIILDCSLSC